MKTVVTGFVNTMSKTQRTAGYVYLPFHIFIIPLFLGMLSAYLPSGMDNIASNIIYFCLGLAFCFIFMWKFLRSAFDVLIDNLLKNLLAFILAYIICILLSYLAASIIFIVFKDAALNPNNKALMDIANDNPRALMGLIVFVAPIVEEVLFRGVLFGSIRPKNRIIAYALSMCLFSFYHIWKYALITMDWTVLIYMVQYIPAGYALAWLYEKTNSIWMPIFLHMSINIISISAF